MVTSDRSAAGAQLDRHEDPRLELGAPAAGAGGAGRDDEVLDLRGACALLKVGKTALYALAAAGKVPHRRVGRQYRFSRAALMRWLSSCSGTDAQEGP